MSKTRTKYAAQDAILAAIVAAAAAETDAALAEAIRSEGAMMAKRWGAKVEGLPDRRRGAD